MGLRIYGVAASENVDNAGEVLKIDGLDTSRLTKLLDEHTPEGQNTDFFHTLGTIDYHKKILSEKDCENPRQKFCWDKTKTPLLYIEGTLADEEGHPNAAAAAALIKFSSRPESAIKIGLSIDGGILRRVNNQGHPDDKGKVLAQSVALATALTTKPCNPKCFLSPMFDLQKSEFLAEPPKAYWEALKKSQAKSSIIQRPHVQMYLKMHTLKKSLEDYLQSFTSMRCKKCGESVRFFKSSSEIPNHCGSCKNPHSMSDVWHALNK